MDVRLRMVTLFVGVFFSCNTVAQELKTFGDSVAYAFGCSSAFGLSFDKKFDKFVCSGFECGLAIYDSSYEKEAGNGNDCFSIDEAKQILMRTQSVADSVAYEADGVVMGFQGATDLYNLWQEAGKMDPLNLKLYFLGFKQRRSKRMLLTQQQIEILIDTLVEEVDSD
ncbi:MAG: hypothetical protein II623_10305 [Paludibacteraceae bacterium]|nr:hypothetical protein [Paludibacteraceae bacterium]